MTGAAENHSQQPAGEGKAPPGVGVAIVNWNARGALERCLETLLLFHRGMRTGIVVVDNASTDGSAAMLGERFPDVELIANDSNRGFAVAANQGLRALSPEYRYLLLLNPDVVFTRDVLGPLVGLMERRAEIGLVTPRVTGADGAVQRGCRRRLPTLMLMAGALTPPGRLFGSGNRYTYGDMSEFEEHEVEAASGSFMLMRREVFEAAGGFDERFFLYAEDLDFCLRARREGFRLHYYPGVSVLHRKGVSSARRPLAAHWHMHRTAWLYVGKHFRGAARLPGRLLARAGLLSRFMLLLPRAALGAAKNGLSRQK